MGRGGGIKSGFRDARMPSLRILGWMPILLGHVSGPTICQDDQGLYFDHDYLYSHDRRGRYGVLDADSFPSSSLSNLSDQLDKALINVFATADRVETVEDF
jgi:hypothetical protein